MTRRIEAGPVLVGLGALVLLISLFLDWYQPAVTAWDAFEVLDLLLAALGVAALVAAAGAIRPEATVIERHWLPAIVAAITIIVVGADPRPAAARSTATRTRAHGSRSAPRSSCASARC